MPPGSVRARGDNRSDSGIDILVELAPDAPMGVSEYPGLKTYIASVFDGPVDVVSRETLKPCLRHGATAEVVYASDAGLRDILHHIDLATRFAAGLDYERFQEDACTVHAVTRWPEIISEASRRLPAALKFRHQ